MRDKERGRSVRPRREPIQEGSFLVSQKSDWFEIVVTGESMWPVLVPGKHYVARRDVEPAVGDIAVATHPYDPTQTIVKRVSAIADGNYTLTGTVSWSSSFSVPRSAIMGVIASD